MGTAEPIIVASATDETYLPLSLVVAASIARHAAPGRRIEYHILYDGPDHWAVDALQRPWPAPLSVVLHRLPNPWVPLGVVSNFPPSTFFRYSLPQVLADHARAIYLDLDVIVEADLAPLFDAPLDGKPIGGVPCSSTVIDALLGLSHAPLPHRKQRWKDYFRETIGLDGDEQMLGYTQAGVLLFDLEQLRAMDFAGQMVEYVTLFRNELALADQCAMNRLLRDRIARVDPRWNRTGYALRRSTERIAPPAMIEQVRRQRRLRGIIHFGGPKPWGEYLIAGSARWWAEALRSRARRHFVDHVLRREKQRIYHYLYHHQHWIIRLHETARRVLGGLAR